VTNFRLDVSRETSEATLWIETDETACGYNPVLARPSIDGAKEFARMLLEIDHRGKSEISNPGNQAKAS